MLNEVRIFEASVFNLKLDWNLTSLIHVTWARVTARSYDLV